MESILNVNGTFYLDSFEDNEGVVDDVGACEPNTSSGR